MPTSNSGGELQAFDARREDSEFGLNIVVSVDWDVFELDEDEARLLHRKLGEALDA